MTTKHTQGPWMWVHYSGLGIYSIKQDLTDINDITSIVGCGDRALDKANAALISAAPEMFEVLEMLANTVVDSADDKVKGLILLTFINMSKEAINKAKGI